MRPLILTTITLSLLACGQTDTAETPAEVHEAPAEVTMTETEDVSTSTSSPSLADILSAQPEKTQARYEYRHPLETLEFFGISPEMTVVEALPGGGWYSKILLPYLGNEGSLIGVDYAPALWPNFGFADAEFLAKKATWIQDWTQDAESWRAPGDASVSATVFGQFPEDMHGTADAILFIRALHNLARFSNAESEVNFLEQALGDAFNVLKPGGIVGVVQHEAPADSPDEWATGAAGYLKKAFVIEQMERAGFEYVSSSDVNANPADQPTTDDIVWRLPPSFATSREDDELNAQMAEIGESNRMTLKFIKPQA